MEEAGHASGRLAHDGHVAGVATEPGDVVLDPLEGHHLVVHTLEKKGCHSGKKSLQETTAMTISKLQRQRL